MTYLGTPCEVQTGWNENVTIMTEEDSVKNLVSAGRHWAPHRIVMPARVSALVPALAEGDH